VEGAYKGNLQMNTFTIDSEFRDLLPPLMDEERERLMTDINKNGCRDPLVVWKEWNILIDGHNRYDICTALDLPFEVVEMSFTSRDDVKIWMIRNQLSRRNITDAKRVVLNLMLKPILAAKAKDNQKQSPGTPDKGLQTFGNLSGGTIEPVHTAKEIAKASGVSHETVRKVETVMKTADEPTKQKMLNGEISINKAFKTTKAESKATEATVQKHTPTKSNVSAMGIEKAHEAIACLKKIPLDDKFRIRAREIVEDWLALNITGESNGKG